MADRRFALGEDVSHDLAALLRGRGWDINSAKDLGRLGLRDPLVLLRAAQAVQTLITHNQNDFRALHEAWLNWRGHWETEVHRRTSAPISLSGHAGILVVPQLPADDLALVLEAGAGVAEPMADRLFRWTPARGWCEPDPLLTPTDG